MPYINQMQSCLVDGHTAGQTSFLRRNLKSKMDSKASLSENIPVPYIDGIKGGMQPGRSVFIKANPTRSPKRVTVNLQSDYADDTDITLHFDIRFHYLGEYGVVVLNTRKDGSFGKEERVSQPFPFVPNEEFNLEITAESSRYKISVDNKHLADFNYRLPVRTGSVLSVSGDLTLYDVRVE